ncbi:MAG: ATP-binding protein [Salinimicrobium sediminis]|uniref:histidine kinase n=1 Tax=Salinimicrobium sediminis TaxID=1343891 RepID=A0A285X0W9_9FLAO|nr:ATP-binding protein [Salinimicrobium sediminis]MDX1602348.1 ATP-binding protein [Salinimicrobium sediminis]SOC79011.1 two-component system, OmpR family, phosphate regulon sensor histidine kinase PhoR [Salinimicrobium sediminis]
MGKSFRRSYKFAVKTSLYVTIFMTLISAVFLIVNDTYSEAALLIYAICCFLFSFLVIQYRVEFFIYKKIKKIYENVSMLNASSLKPDHVTTDMATLSQEVQKFAEGKKLEIEALKVRDSYRKEFMGNISHELKTPLFTVQGYIETLLDGAMNDKKVRQQYLERAAKGVERLVYIVRDLDMITKLETGDLRLKQEAFDIVELIQNVFDLLEMKAAKKNISLVFETPYAPLMVKADKERIQQVVTNLLVNSIKYGKKDGTTEVSIQEHSKKKIIIKVSDNGEGIQKEHIPRLFERFYRVDKSGSRKEGGSGLGLAIVKHLLEAHKERIFVTSTFGMGSEFSFTLKKAKKTAVVTDKSGVV